VTIKHTLKMKELKIANQIRLALDPKSRIHVQGGKFTVDGIYALAEIGEDVFEHSLSFSIPNTIGRVSWDNMEIENKDDDVILSLTSGNAKVEILTKPEENSQRFDDLSVSEVGVSLIDILGHIKKVSNYCSNDQLRPAMMCVLVQVFEEGLVCVATNAQILSMHRTSEEIHKWSVKTYDDILIHPKVMSVLKRLKNVTELSYYTDKKRATYVIVSEGVTIKLHSEIEDRYKYPDYWAVIPKPEDLTTHFIFQAKEMAKEFAAISKVCISGDNSANFKIKEGAPMVVTVKDEYMAFDYRCEIPGVASGLEDISKISHRNFTKLLSSCVGECTLSMNAHHGRANIIKDSARNTHIIMPML